MLLSLEPDQMIIMLPQLFSSLDDYLSIYFKQGQSIYGYLNMEFTIFMVLRSVVRAMALVIIFIQIGSCAL